MKSIDELEESNKWLQFLMRENQSRRIFPAQGLREAAGFVWFRVCMNSAWMGSKVWQVYQRSPLRTAHHPLFREQLTLILNSVRTPISAEKAKPSGGLEIWEKNG